MKTKPKKVRVKKCNYCDTPNCKLPCHNNTNNQLKADQPRAGKLEEELIKLLKEHEDISWQAGEGLADENKLEKIERKIKHFIHTNYQPKVDQPWAGIPREEMKEIKRWVEETKKEITDGSYLDVFGTKIYKGFAFIDANELLEKLKTL